MEKFKIIILLVSIISLQGCLFGPQLVDIPLISEKEEIRIDVGVSSMIQTNATISYGLTDKIAVQGFTNLGGDENYFQAAGGYYNKVSSNKVLEVYGGFGYGLSDLFSTITGGNLMGDYQLYFGQVNYGKIADSNSNFEYAMSLKTGYLHANLLDEGFHDIDLNLGNYKDDGILLEPSALFRFGGEKFKFNMKFGYNYFFDFNNNQAPRTPYSQLNIGLGLNYNLRQSR